MKLIKHIEDWEITNKETIKTREASRAILFDENNLIPLLFVSKHNYHKLPGGGIDRWETKKEALIRECLEEVGCEIEIISEIWKITEFKSQKKLYQTSYCYTWKIISKWKPNFTQKELDNWFQIVRLSLEDAISTLKNDKPNNYIWKKFIQERDLTFLEYFSKN